MLVLSMTENEYLEIGDGVRVYFQWHPDGEALSVAIAAPADQKVLRGKLYEAANPGKRNDGVPHRRNDRRPRRVG